MQKIHSTLVLSGEIEPEEGARTDPPDALTASTTPKAEKNHSTNDWKKRKLALPVPLSAQASADRAVYWHRSFAPEERLPVLLAESSFGTFVSHVSTSCIGAHAYCVSPFLRV